MRKVVAWLLAASVTIGVPALAGTDLQAAEEPRRG